jgi:hypothetical protein
MANLLSYMITRGINSFDLTLTLRPSELKVQKVSHMIQLILATDIVCRGSGRGGHSISVPTYFVYPAPAVHSAALIVVGIVIWKSNLPVFSFTLDVIAFAESIGLPPPILMIVSMELS